MDPINLKRTHNPEADIQRDIIKFLEQRGWHVMPTHGNASQKGFPDLYCTHRQYGQRWIEVKNPHYYEFTKAQLEHFPQINDAGIGIWIMMEATQEAYAALFSKGEGPDKGKGNWVRYYRDKQLLGSRNHAARTRS